MPAFIRESAHFQSADGKTPVAAFFYTPTVQPIRAVVQLSHGALRGRDRSMRQ